jgi:hypothetical protein
MATKIFKLVGQHECSAAKNSGMIGICNLSPYKVDVTEMGHSIPQFGHAIVDKLDSVGEAMVESGRIKIDQITVRVSESESPAKKTSSKKKVGSEATEQPVEIEEIKEETEPEDTGSTEPAEGEESGNL